MEEQMKMMHFLLISFPAQGHIKPMLRLAKLIASKGFLVTFSTNHFGGQKLAATEPANAVSDAPIAVGKGYLRFEFFYDGVVAYDVGGVDGMLRQLHSAGPAAVAAMIRRQAGAGRPVACVVNNPFLPWVVDVAAGLKVPAALLWVQSCAVYTIYHHYHHSRLSFPGSGERWEGFTAELPGLPPLQADELPSFLVGTGPFQVLGELILEQMEKMGKVAWVLVNSFDELEGAVLGAAPARLATVGPLVLSGGGEGPAVADGNMWAASGECMGWLDGCPAASVIYVSLGSVVVLHADEVAELARGLKESGKRFLWVLKPWSTGSDTGLPAGFEEEVAERGMVVEWCHQESVLAHPAVAAFLTHCGWNSSLEALAAGVPIVALPHLSDQKTNAKFLVDVYGVGVRIRELTATEIGQRVEEIFVGPVAEKIRRNVATWKCRAAKAMAGGGSSDRNIMEFVDDIRSRWAGESKDPDPNGTMDQTLEELPCV